MAIDEDLLDLQLVVQRDGRLLMKTIGYHFPDLSLPSTVSASSCMAYSREKAWKVSQQLLKIQAVFMVQDPDYTKVFKKMADEKAKSTAIHPILTSMIFPEDDFDNTGDIYKANWVCFLQAALPYQLMTMVPDTKTDVKVGNDRVLTAMIKLIKSGAQVCEPSVSYWQPEYEAAFREDLHSLFIWMVEHVMDTRKLLPSIGLQALKIENTQRTIASLESMINERLEHKKEITVYQMAIDFAKKTFTKSKNVTPPHSHDVEDECKIL